MIGREIKDFKLVARLGKGGWGEVWAAEQPIVKTRVAIKLLRSDVSGDQAHVTRFFNEARAVGSIPHAGITKIFDVGYEGEQAFLIMEMLDGEPLTSRIRRQTRLALDEVIDIGCQIASVLAATHAAGVVHRDLKPDNVFLVPDAELGERVKVLDFGIAKLATVNVTGTGSLGTPAYMAPEQWSSPATADHRADLYSLGCVLFEMCCGRTPFIATTPGEACAKHLTEEPPRARSLVPALPVEIDEMIARLLAKQPEARPEIAEIDRVLIAALGGAPRGMRFPRASHPPFRGTGDRMETAETLSSTPANATILSLAGKSNAVTSRAEPRITTLAGVTPARASSVSTTSLAGAVVAKTTPPPSSSRAPKLAMGGLAAAAVAGAIVFAATRGPAEPTGRPLEQEIPGAPKLGLATIADYDNPTPATLINHRSEQIWLAAHDDFERACKLPAAPVRWCAGVELANGQLALMRDDIPGAIAAFEKAVARDSTWSTAFLGLADASAHAGKRDAALAAARAAQALEPFAYQPAMASARALISAGEVDDALIEYRRAMSLAPPNNPVVLGEIALAFHFAGKDDEAKKLTQQAIALDKTLVNVHILQAELALEARDGKTALTEADAALAVSPKNGAALIARGDALVLLDRRDEALVSFRRALELRGGLNLLAMSKTRLAAVEAAVAQGEVPPPRGVVRAQPPQTEQAREERSRPDDAESAVERTPGTKHPGPRASFGESSRTMSEKSPITPAERTPPRESPKTPERAAPSSNEQPTRTPPSKPDKADRSSPGPSPPPPPSSDRSPPEPTKPAVSTDRTPPNPQDRSKERTPPRTTPAQRTPPSRRPERSPPTPIDL